ncbi:hypothetical protein HYT25_01100 [Candidatus Pacearchaeota archaeon]|nr:hypothetical protein [Candidatus Pacearchaeota archaeon]
MKSIDWDFNNVLINEFLSGFCGYESIDELARGNYINGALWAFGSFATTTFAYALAESTSRSEISEQ